MRGLRKKINNLIRRKRDEIILHQHHFYPINYSKPQDIFVVGYPKSGNTWVQHQLASLIFQIKAATIPDQLVQELIPKIDNKQYYKRFSDKVYFSTHSLPDPRFKKVIYLVRDGRDAMISYFHMNQNLDIDISLEEMIVEGKGLYSGKWYNHIEQWLRNPHRSKILFVKYEDMLRQPVLELERMCDFLELKRKEEDLLDIAKGTSFNSMSKKEDKQGWDNKDWKVDKKFVRKGQTQSYLEEMSKELQAYFNAEAKNALTHFNYL